MKSKQEMISDAIHDTVSNFLYYDRKNDEELCVGDIESMIASGEMTKKMIVDRFSACLSERLDDVGGEK